ncbi:hypothetical protein DFP72DRAFT_1066654 [Ephemerocybe angulata]|uniref:Nephrocystin 3-like N-terminal domain-containing protein n=1 Tax=Ephemerocybe angulata TaxID=980116 RepID=A0A8H6M675_9AGAR|nr:hypothetical protein DFP72DRAFT_1066654 [Tulosesus angulatus]
MQNVGNANFGPNYGSFTQQSVGDYSGAELLKILSKRVFPSAIHDSHDREDAPKCHPGTNISILEEIMGFVSKPYVDTEVGKIMWLTGPGGTGKTAILGTIADKCQDEGILAPNFFFSSSSSDWRCLVATLASQLWGRKDLPGIQEHILSALRNSPLIFTKSLKQQFDYIIVAPLSRSLKQRGGSNSATPVILIDGLDECNADQSITTSDKVLSAVGLKRNAKATILRFIVHVVNNPYIPIRVLVGSRAEHAILNFVENEGKAFVRKLVLDFEPGADIALFCEARFSFIRRTLSPDLPEDWPGEERKRTFLDHVSGRFICAAKAMRYVEGVSSKDTGKGTPDERLERLLRLHLSPTLLFALSIRTIFKISRETPDELYERGTEAWHRHDTSDTFKGIHLAKAIAFYREAQRLEAVEGTTDGPARAENPALEAMDSANRPWWAPMHNHPILSALKRRRSEKTSAEELYMMGARAWAEYLGNDQKSSQQLEDALEHYRKALQLTRGEHRLRQIILLDLIFALLENESPSQEDLALIEEHFADLQGIKPLESNTRCYYIVTKLGGYYEELWKTSSQESDFESCIVNYSLAANYGTSKEDGVELFLVIAELHLRRKESSHKKKALEAFRSARSACPQTEEWIHERYQIAKGLYVTHTRLSNAGKDKAHLESAIAECGSALDLRAPQEDRLQLLVDYVRYVWVLLDNYEGTPAAAVLKKAATHGREALDWFNNTGDNDGAKHTVIVLLANILSYPSEILRKKDLDEALLLYERAEVVAPMDGDLLSKMADAVWLKSQRTNDFEGLQKAINIFVRAYDETAQKLRPSIANNIATIYLEKADNTNVPDLKLAREYYSKAEKDSTEDGRPYFAEKIKEIDDAVKELEGGERGTENQEVAPRKKVSGQRRQATRKSTLE